VVEHLLCKQGVAGSNPVISTRYWQSQAISARQTPDMVSCRLIGHLTRGTTMRLMPPGIDDSGRGATLRRPGRLWLICTTAGLLGSTLLASGPAGAAEAPKGLSMRERATALAAMTEIERAGRLPTFSDPHRVIVSYSRVFIPVDSLGRPVGALQVEEFRPGMAHDGRFSPQATYSGLTVTVSVNYDYEAPPYRWDVQAYFDWSGWIPSTDGEDSFAIAWANGLALQSDYMWGAYTNGTTFYPNHVPSSYRSDMTPNVGVGWSFNEYYYGSYADYGWLTATISENTFQNRLTNVVAKYFHTYTSQDYSLGFSASGPSISISPTSNQWSLAEYTSFTA
jgi:hypothetical protein